ncbi:RICIN domain-containing protein [Streptomyces aureocirculatus]|uniref:RICIN domain-containing protein n=1 Tax=Streptomyces aureocirculatus TaxID=67275 RepID=UPI0004C65463|nr:hypothetical protein [Streptomyces aureocirculatus]
MGFESGTYMIKCAAYADRVLDVCNGYAAPNVPVIGWPWHKSENQVWEVTQAYGPGDVVIKSTLGDYFLNTSSERSYPPKLAVQSFYVVWHIAPIDDNTFRIGYPGTHQVVTLSNDDQGTQAAIQDGTFAASQRWLLERV